MTEKEIISEIDRLERQLTYEHGGAEQLRIIAEIQKLEYELKGRRAAKGSLCPTDTWRV